MKYHCNAKRVGDNDQWREMETQSAISSGVERCCSLWSAAPEYWNVV